MKNLLSTYRIQFNKDFTLQDFEKIKTYFKKLGVKTIYGSPIFEAVPGSTHGYDVCNPSQIGAEIGTESQLLNISHWLKEEKMFWLQDIVPNHMAFHPKNAWLMDLLEKGTKSLFTNYFDSVYTCPVMQGKLMVPVLGEDLETAIDAEKIKIKWTGERLVLCYSNNPFPLKPSSYSFFLEKLKLDNLVHEVQLLADITSKEEYAERWENILTQIRETIGAPETAFELQNLLDAYNQNKQLIIQTSRAQYYELCLWQETNKRINYRRFFTVNGLICLNMADETVFAKHHQFIKKMVDSEVFDGLRIDHIDGLFEPTEYLKRLRKLAGQETYIIAEKILEKGEEIPVAWPIQGNTGYDFLGIINNLFTQNTAAQEFDNFYETINPSKAIAEDELLKKRYILENHLAGELENLYKLFEKLQLSTEVLEKENLKKAIAALLINMPVYRFYSEDFPLNKADQQALAIVFENIKSREIPFRKEAEKLEEIFLAPNTDKSAIWNKAVTIFFKRLMQFSGPLMAKGVEDTLMYTNFRFIGHNEVGDHPASFGITADEFHRLMQHRQKQNPLSLNTTSTHDTKRGEDARARLNVLTALPTEWFNKVKAWQQLNAQKREELQLALHEEYFIYQCLLANYPLVKAEEADFEERLNAYLQKAFREGKQQSDWANVNSKFEENVAGYIAFLLNPKNPFLPDFKAYHQKIALYGVYNSLAQLGLKFTSPGIPDVYQGGEFWDFSFVDPDNRRKVDYNLRMQELEKFDSVSIDELMVDYSTGGIKLWLTQQLYKLRNEANDIFSLGDYRPLKVTGKYQNNVIAFIRQVQQQTLLVISVINSAGILESQNVAFEAINWEDTQVILPEEANWYNVFQKNEGGGKAVLLQDISLKIPFAVCKLSGKNSRNAGILMHISSLPSAFGIGDLGLEAYRFVDFLKHSGQRYWQVLPIGTGAGEHDLSPYSTLCSRATNPLFISPESLVADGYLQETDFADFREEATTTINFQQVKATKTQLLKKAFLNFRTQSAEDNAFQKFIADEKDWLPDYSLFTVLRNKLNQPWFEWPNEFKLRDTTALIEFSNDYKEEILEQQWYQYVFKQQWESLKSYCSQNYIHLIGDLPFYVNHDSSDVWANPTLFSLNEDGSIDKTAGVPPDYFSAYGQLWNMPVYNWEAMAKDEYKWWINRIGKNLSWFNLLRLDHFRAFYNYWQVNGTESTAVNGEWRMAPGLDFLNEVKAKFPEMPFIAEDLGDVSSEIFDLRDEFDLAGMKVLQFAFGEDMPVSAYIPHQHSANFIVYTGTHDNNTIKGWFKNDLTESGKKRLSAYLNKNVDEHNVADSLIKMAYASVAKTAIIPIQDILNLDEDSRMNIPGKASDNWSFRILPDQCNSNCAQQLRLITEVYGRASTSER
ncbi:MAG TPA: malto-oligosyltrehalose synthase [Pelobium sp.]|nr:malto-oligosyltrehalose synthase [Pelobium sp.]